MPFSGNLETQKPKRFPVVLIMVEPYGITELSNDYLLDYFWEKLATMYMW